ncbi:uncharacterized protein LOC128554304 [Mercenaria mercenaria]|uniref:uncharacterized protein LOC128554304 n=1 Tax=Mercenaria mercenaria TaxID=6596 RepID=UPI00234F3AE2|nr:uncharacterized protein LOC128554304 [Mercenaria mercenaria]XP_053391541.1 uncharacterized protein LOC128554304 [Mercenaria mercenaria]
MVSILIVSVIDEIIAAIAYAVEKLEMEAVVESLLAAVTMVMEVAVHVNTEETEDSTVSDNITTQTTEAVEAALQKDLNQAVKDVIDSQGVKDLSKAITEMPSDVVVDKLAKAALDAIDPHLRVFKDPAFIRLTKMIRVIRAIEKGDIPEDEDDDDCDEEKCRFFKGPIMKDDMEDFVFFSVFGNSDCKEGDEVYSMCAQWKKLKSLVDDPFGGHYVSQLFQELFESCAEDDDAEKFESSLSTQPGKMVKKKIVEVKYGKLVYFGNKVVHNVANSSNDKRSTNWLKTYFVHGYGECGKCYIGSEDPVCGHSNPLEGNIVGGHLWNDDLKKKDMGLYYYILPICKRHNKRNVYDEPKPDGTGWLMTLPESYAMKITSTELVPGWKGMVSQLKGSMLMGAFGEENVRECPAVIQPKLLTNWVLEKVHIIALEFSKIPVETVLKEVSLKVLEKLKDIIKSAGDDANEWAQREVNDIKDSLNSFWGIVQATKRLYKLKEDAIDRFHSNAQSALSNYKNECLGSNEQAHRKQRLLDETNKVISSKEWKDRIATFEETIASKVLSTI